MIYSNRELLDFMQYGTGDISEKDLKENLIYILEDLNSFKPDEILLPEGGVDDDLLDAEIDKIYDLIDGCRELSKGDMLNYLTDLCKELRNIQHKVNGQFEDYQKSAESIIEKFANLFRMDVN